MSPWVRHGAGTIGEGVNGQGRNDEGDRWFNTESTMQIHGLEYSASGQLESFD